jgi:hypothetical protein
MAVIIRLVRQKVCCHRWITVWIGRDAVYDVCLLCRQRIIGREAKSERIPSRGANGMNGSDVADRVRGTTVASASVSSLERNRSEGSTRRLESMLTACPRLWRRAAPSNCGQDRRSIPETRRYLAERGRDAGKTNQVCCTRIRGK